MSGRAWVAPRRAMVTFAMKSAYASPRAGAASARVRAHDAPPHTAPPHVLTAAGAPAQLDIRVAGERSIRVTLRPLTAPVRRRVGALDVSVSPAPLAVTIAGERRRGSRIRITWHDARRTARCAGAAVTAPF